MGFKQNTAADIFFVGVHSSTGAPTAGLTWTGYLTIDGGAQGAVTGTFTDLTNGQYRFNGAAGDFNGLEVGLMFTAASTIPVSFSIKTDTKIVSELNDFDAAADEVALVTLATTTTTCTTTTTNTDTAATLAGISVLADWLGAIAGKVADAPTLAEINATTAGATYVNTTDSQEAIRDHIGDGTTLTEAGGDGDHLTNIGTIATCTTVTNGVTLANGAVTDVSLAGNMEIVFETDFATNYNATRKAWVTNTQDFVGTTAADPFAGKVVAASVTAKTGYSLAADQSAVTIGTVTLVTTTTTNTDLAAHDGKLDGLITTVGVAGAGLSDITLAADQSTVTVGTVTLVTTTTTNTDVTALAATVGVAGVGLSDLGGMSAAMIAEVTAAADAALTTTTYGEPGQGAPPVTASVEDKIGYLYKMFRNEKRQSATEFDLYNDAADTIDQQATVADSGTVATKGEMGTGA